MSWREARPSRQGWKNAISWLVRADLKNSKWETRQRRGEGWMTVWKEGRREGNYAEAPAGPPPVSGTVLDKAPGLRTGGNTGVRLRSWWEIRKTRRCWLAPNSPFFPTGETDTTLCRRCRLPEINNSCGKPPLLCGRSGESVPSSIFFHPRIRQCFLDSRVTVAVVLGWLADFSVIKVLSFIRPEYLQWNIYLGGRKSSSSCTLT